MRRIPSHVQIVKTTRHAAWHELVYITHSYRASVQRIDYNSHTDEDDEDEPTWREKSDAAELGSTSESEELESITSNLQRWIEKHRQLLQIPEGSNGYKETIDFFSKYADEHDHKMASSEVFLLGFDLFGLMQGKICADVTETKNADETIGLYINYVLNQRSQGISFIPFSLTECMMLQHIIANRTDFENILGMHYDDFVCELCDIATESALEIALQNADKRSPDDIAIDIDSIPSLSLWHIIHNICCDMINDELDNQNPNGILDDETVTCLNSCAESIRVARKLSGYTTSSKLPLSAESWEFISDRLQSLLQHPSYASVLGNLWELDDDDLKFASNQSLIKYSHMSDDGDDDTPGSDIMLLEMWHRKLSEAYADEAFRTMQRIKSNLTRATAALNRQTSRESK